MDPLPSKLYAAQIYRQKRTPHKLVTAWKTRLALSHEHILPLFHFAHIPYTDFFFPCYLPSALQATLYDILKRGDRPT